MKLLNLTNTTLFRILSFCLLCALVSCDDKIPENLPEEDVLISPFKEIKKIALPNSKYFGSTTYLSNDGNTLLVGTSGEVSGNPQEAVAAAIYEKSDTNWLLRSFIKVDVPSNLIITLGFTALSADGNVVTVAAHEYDRASSNNEYVVYVFKKASISSWTRVARLVGKQPLTLEQYGDFIALSNDGNTIAVKARGYRQQDGRVGAIYVYKNNGTTWDLETQLFPDVPGDSHYFAFSVALSADGNKILVGAVDPNGGVVYSFTKNASGWQKQEKIKPRETQIGDAFGVSIAFSKDGSVALIGAQAYDFNATGNSLNTGAAYVFKQVGTTWSQQKQLRPKASDPIHIGFGTSVSLSSDGTKALINSLDAQTIGYVSAGTFYFELDNGVWKYQNIRKGSDTKAGDNFGYGIITGDGSKLFIAAKYFDSPLGGDSGQLYIFGR